MEIIKKQILTAKKYSLQEIQTGDIITTDDVLRAYENIFKKIEKIVMNSDISFSDFEVGKLKNSNEVIYFTPHLGWGFISGNSEGYVTHKLEDIIEYLYSPKKIRDNLVPILRRISEINQKKIHKLNSELDFVRDFPI